MDNEDFNANAHHADTSSSALVSDAGGDPSVPAAASSISPEATTASTDEPGHALLDEIKAEIIKHVYLSDEAATAMTLWLLQTYVSGAFHYRPRLVFSSPVRGCGKTTALKIAELLAHAPRLTANITAAALFRTIEAQKPTLLIDEADSFLKGNETLRGIVNAGFERNGVITRCVGDSHTPKDFFCSSPMAIATIGQLQSTIVDRSIVINMERKPREHKIERIESHRPEQSERYKVLTRRCDVWARSNLAKLKSYEPKVPELASDRALDCWRPLIAISELAGGSWPNKARVAAVHLTDDRERPMKDDRHLQVLEDIQKIARTEGLDRIPSKKLCEELATMEDRPWPEFIRGQPITPPQLANLLGSFDIKPGTIRLPAGETIKGYKCNQFEHAWRLYLKK